MRLKVIGSNSRGNGYILQAKDQTLLIECGIHLNKIKQALDFNLKDVTAVVTHSHGDHAKYIKNVLNAGINVYAGKETFGATGTDKHHRANVMEAGKVYTIGSFKIKPFNVNHDVPCFGFIISHPECGLLLFLTDTYYCNYTFPGLNNIIVECNHDVDIIKANETATFLQERIVQSHMNVKTCKALLLANDLSKVNNIVLIHLSNANSDELGFKKEIEAATNKTVWIAEAGMIVENFNKTPF